MSIFDVITNSEIEAIILPVDRDDLPHIKKSKRFGFNWHLFKDEKVYKLMRKGDPEILGLMCLEDHSVGWDAIEIKLLEVGRAHIGKNKKIEKIAGCLIAYACRESIKNGHGGWVFLKPKTKLIDHYINAYG